MARAGRFLTGLATLLLGFLFSGCTPRISGRYQVRKTDEGPIVLPPPYWEHPATKPVKVQVSVARNSASQNSSGCSAASGPFRLFPTNGSHPKWNVTLPSFAAWQASISKGDFSQQLAGFLDDLGRVESNGCLPGSTGVLVERAVREGVPVQIHDILYYRYDWQPAEGFVNLEPGMRLKIERSELGPGGKIVGARTSTTYYLVGRDSRGAIAFRLTGSGSGSAPIEDSDRTLSTRIQGMPYVRLFLSGDHVPNNLRYTALIIGTHTQEQMTQVEEALRAHPEIGCSQQPDQEVACVMFRGSVTVSAELGVTVNGQRDFVGLEAGVQSLFDPPRSQCALGSLRVERQFLDGRAPIEFGATRDSALDLMLVGGDRVACAAFR